MAWSKLDICNWGAIHGFYLIFAIWTKNFVTKIYNFLHLKKGSRTRKFVDVFITFHLVLFAWVFFRANSFNDAIYILTHIFPLNLGDFISALNSTGATASYAGLNKERY